MTGTTRLYPLIADKWQIPLLPLAAAALWMSLPPAPPSPPPPEETFHALRAEMYRAFEEGRYTTATALGARLLGWSIITEAQRAELHLCMARSLLLLAPSERPGPDLTARVGHHLAKARELGASPTAEDYAAWAEALAANGQYFEALAQFEQALNRGGDVEHLMRRMLELRHDLLHQPPESLVDDYLAYTECVEQDAELLGWALPRLVAVLLEQNQPGEAWEALQRWRAEVAEPIAAARLDLLMGETLYRMGRLDEAELMLRGARLRGMEDEISEAGAAVLLGRILVSSNEPGDAMEALASFDESLRLSPSGPWSAAAHIGTAEILAEMRRDTEAAEAFTEALTKLAWAENPADEAVRLRVSLMQCAHSARMQGRLEAAFRYLDLAAPLAAECSSEVAAAHREIQAQTCAALARRLRETQATRPGVPAARDREESQDDPDESARRMFRLAGECYETIARLEGIPSDVVASALFNAADMYGEALDGDVAAELFEQVAVRFPGNSRAAPALLRRGQWLQARGRFAEAIAAYERCIDEYPGTLPALQALVPLAETCLVMGDDDARLSQAEELLQHLLGDVDIVHPDAREFEDALFLLGRVVERRGQYERAITIYTEALDRYPNSPQRDATMFALADAYRRSGLALKEAARKAMHEGSEGGAPLDYAQRLGEARRLYDRVVAAYERRYPSGLTPLERLYYRYAMLYEADCLFETLQYAEAIKLYQAAAGVLFEHVDVLSAHVQIINCHVFLGQTREARAALDGARRALERLPDEAFRASLTGQSREAWKQYFDWLDQTRLF